MPHTDFWPFSKSKVSDDESREGETSILQKQLGAMEGEVKDIQMELAAIKKDRQHLLRKNKVLHLTHNESDQGVIISPTPEDKCTVVVETAKLRQELIRAKNCADQERLQREQYERKLKDLEYKLNSICSTGHIPEIEEVRKPPDTDVSGLKCELRDLREELEETHLTINEKNEQIQDYRSKYLQAQQNVEELKRQLDVVDFDNKQVSDQIQIEIQRMKMQFQEKLQELAPLPDLLKGAQIQLQEAKQLQKLAEDSSQQYSNEVQRVKEKLIMAVNSLNQEKAEKLQLLEDNKHLKSVRLENQKVMENLAKDLDEQKCTSLRLQEKLSQLELRFKEKSSECSTLLKELDEVRAEMSRSLGRGKERAESMRRYLQAQISELERQLVQSRAQCRACQKERDEIRQRMQMQISNLQENFELVEIRLRALQGQVNSLKNSYAVIISDEEDSSEFNKIANLNLN